MSFSFGVATWLLLGVSCLNLGLAIMAVRRRGVQGAVPFAATMICVSLYASGSAVQGASTTLATYRGGLFVSYVGLVGLPPTQLWFVLAYAGHESLLRRRAGVLLLVEPAIVLALAATSPMHDLLWTITGFTGAPMAYVDRALGPAFWLNIVYSYALLFVSYLIIILVGIRRHRRYRIQVGLILFGGLVPLLVSLFWVSGISPLGSVTLGGFSVGLPSSIDPTPFAFGVTGITFAVALFRFDFLELAPVARHALVDEMTDPIFVVDLDGQVVEVNAAAVELLDTETPVIGQPASDIVPSYGSTAEDENAPEADVSVESADGKRYFDVTQTALTDQTGAELGSLLIYRDVTDRHVVEERFQRLIERSSDVVTVMQKDGTVTYVSPSVSEILGYDPEEMIGENIIDRIHPNDREEIIMELSRHADDYGFVGQYVARYRDADGNWRTMEARATNLLGDPYVEGIVLNSRDVTKQRQRKRQLERQNERLDQFASIVAHDLRNPLNVAAGRAELLKPDVDEETAAAIDDIQRQLGRMEDIIEDSLTLARAGEIAAETADVDIGTLARDAWENVATGEATLVVETTLELEADGDRLLNVFENLYRNSVEHNDSTEMTVEVGPLSGGRGFYVEDTGTGIPERERQNVLKQGYTTSQQGTGFGLAIVQDIIKAHGWQLSVSEGEEGGARFEIECSESLPEKEPGHATSD
ncbi:histidine kinase N-terminal 7TM domain-containing protein [Haloplanus ruber]|uniref:histidine kinase n=1 Tax=Haloplanus ruber TaxID=869892 RepID=A0ABD6CZH3_9EURY|nr:histidine kinase N-terminal 7TM domain-containing protein [Haloplanus ruber]